jgi:hypothetical protein
MKEKIGKEGLEQRALAAVRSKQGCYGTLQVTVERHAEPDGLGRTWHITSIEPHILDPDASFRAFQAAAGLQDQYDLTG